MNFIFCMAGYVLVFAIVLIGYGVMIGGKPGGNAVLKWEAQIAKKAGRLAFRGLGKFFNWVASLF